MAESDGTHDLSTHSFKVYLSNAQPNPATHTIKADIAEIATGNGYSGPVTVTLTSRGIVSNEYVLVPQGPIVWTGTGSGFGPLRYAVLYNDTPTDKPLVGFWDYPTQITLLDAGEILTLSITPSTGLLKLT